MSDPRRPLRQGLERTLWKIYELEATVSDFSGNQDLLDTRLNQLVEELAGLQAQRELLAVEVPVDLLRYVDEGGNPDSFTADIFKAARAGNQAAKGKVEAFRGFRQQLLEQAQQAFPADTAAYLALTAGAAPSPPAAAPHPVTAAPSAAALGQ